MYQKVFVTGASGYIARHILAMLIEQGVAVRGSVRSSTKAEETRRAIEAYLGRSIPEDQLEFVTLDLTRDDGWDSALRGCDALMHTASPFPMTPPKDESALIAPAVDGTLRALKAAKAAGIERVILTSSIVSIVSQFPILDSQTFTEADWSNTDSPVIPAYSKSKTLAERAAWDFVNDTGLQMTTINPSMVQGAPIGEDFGTSVRLIKRILTGADPMTADLMFEVVSVRDVAAMHVLALFDPATIGQRYIASSGPMRLPEMARLLKQTFPHRKVRTAIAPKWLFGVLALFDRSMKQVKPNLGTSQYCDNAKAKREMGMQFEPPEALIIETGRYVDARL